MDFFSHGAQMNFAPSSYPFDGFGGSLPQQTVLPDRYFAAFPYAQMDPTTGTASQIPTTEFGYTHNYAQMSTGYQPPLVAPGPSPASAPPAPAPRPPKSRRTGATGSEVGPRRSKKNVRFDPIQPQRRHREKKRGRRRGAVNYTPDEINTFLDFVVEELPIGGKGWAVVGARFRDVAQSNGFPLRTNLSLKNKFNSLLKVTRRTGEGECPEYVERAHEAHDSIQSKIGSRDHDDDELADELEDSGDDEDLEMSEFGDESDNSDNEDPTPTVPPPITTQRAPHVRTVKIDTPLPSRFSNTNNRKPASRGLDLLASMGEAFDPQNLSQRESERASMLYHQQQLLVLQNQNFSLQTQLAQSERRRNIAERRADRLEYKLGIALSAQSRGRRSSISPPPAISRITRWKATYRDGGHATWFGRFEDGPADVADAANVQTIPWSPTSPPREAASPPDSLDGDGTEDFA